MAATPSLSASLITDRIFVPKIWCRFARSSSSPSVSIGFISRTPFCSAASPLSTLRNGTICFSTHRYRAAGTPRMSRSMVCSNKIVATMREPSNAGSVITRVRIAWTRSNISSPEVYRPSPMPYSASAFGVLPPLWSSAARNPRPERTFSSCVASMPAILAAPHRSVRSAVHQQRPPPPRALAGKGLSGESLQSRHRTRPGRSLSPGQQHPPRDTRRRPPGPIGGGQGPAALGPALSGKTGEENFGWDVQNRVAAPTRGRAPARGAAARRSHAMKYMIMMFGGLGAATQDRSAEWIAGMHELLMKLDTELKESGECVASDALADPSQAKTVRFTNGAPVPTDGPFAEVKESLAGYWIVDADEDRALQIASRVVGYTEYPMEVRRIMDHSAQP